MSGVVRHLEDGPTVTSLSATRANLQYNLRLLFTVSALSGSFFLIINGSTSAIYLKLIQNLLRLCFRLLQDIIYKVVFNQLQLGLLNYQSCGFFLIKFKFLSDQGRGRLQL